MARKTPCEGHCGRLFWKKDMVYGPDPFAEEIHDDHTPMWLCDDCYKDLLWEI